MIKLWYNGIQRKIVIDDLLPVSKEGTLMCTYSTNRNELWASLTEKAVRNFICSSSVSYDSSSTYYITM